MIYRCLLDDRATQRDRCYPFAHRFLRKRPALAGTFRIIHWNLQPCISPRGYHSLTGSTVLSPNLARITLPWASNWNIANSPLSE